MAALPLRGKQRQVDRQPPNSPEQVRE